MAGQQDMKCPQCGEQISGNQIASAMARRRDPEEHRASAIKAGQVTKEADLPQRA